MKDSEKKVKPVKIDYATALLALILIIAFIIILCCLISKFYNKMQIAKDKIATLNDKIEIISNEKETISIEQLDIESEEVRKLYGVIKMHNFSTETVNFHRKDDLTQENIDNKTKLLVILNECFVRDLDVENLNINGWGDIYAKDVKAIAKELFGDENSVELEDILDQGLEFTYDENEEKYISEINPDTNGELPNVADYSELLFAEKIEDKVYLYDRYARVTGRAFVKDDKVGVYATSDKEVVIDEKLSRDDLNGILSRLDSEGTKYLLDEELISLRTEYKENILTFRHEFKQNEDGTYQWLSSAPIY